MERLIDIPGLADRWSVSEDHIRALVKQRKVPFTRLPGVGESGGKLVRFTPEQIAEMEAAGEQPALNGPLARPQLRSVPTSSEEIAA